MKWNVKSLLLLFFLCFLITSCLETGGDEEGFSIIIPPGDLVTYSADEFLDQSDENYTVVVRKVGDGNKSLQTLIDVTPTDSDRLARGKVHKTIVPKGSSLSGFLILEVEMDYHNTHYYAFIFNSETPVRPNIFSSLTYELLANYPGRSIKSYTQAEVEKIQARIEQIATERMDFFELDFTVKMDLLYKFLKNTLSSNYDFLTELSSDHNINFTFDMAGDVLEAPFPFGEANSTPVINEQATTRQGLRTVQEMQDGKLKVLAIDPDGDIIFYVWNFEDEFFDAGVTNFLWTPTFSDSRVDPYKVSAIVSDGGKILTVDWDLKVLNVNRPPEIMLDCTEDTVVEGNEIRCSFNVSDPDNEGNFVWQLGTSGFLGSATLNGQAPGTQVSAETVEIAFTPNNGDAKRSVATFELNVNDGAGGADVFIFSVNVTDINQPPVILDPDLITPSNDDHLEPREWDYCLNRDVYGMTEAEVANGDTNGAFKFKVTLQDPDNVAGADPKDEITLRLVGLGTQNISQIARVVDNTANTVTYEYQWKPNHTSKVADISFILNDDHGGSAPLVIKNLVAKDINQRACMRWSVNGAVPYIDEVLRTYYRYPHYGRDWDGDIPVIERESIDLELLPHSTLYYGNTAIVPRQKFGELEPTYNTQFSKQYQGSRVYAKSKYSGVLQFTRSVEGTSDVTVAEGFSVALNEASTGHLVEFETVEDVTIEKDDQFVYVPIQAVNRTVPSNGLSVLLDPLTDSTITVSHSSITGDSAWVTLTRGAGSTNLDVVIPEDTRLVSAPGNTSFEFKVSGNFFMASGESTVSVPVYRSKKSFPVNSVIDHLSVDPGITLSLPTQPRDYIGYQINPYKGWVEHDMKWHAFDGAQTNVGTVVIIDGALASSTLSVTNANSFYKKGEVVFSRPLTDAVSSLTVPAGTPLKAENDNNYLTTESITFASGETSKTVSVERTIAESLNQHWFKYRFRDYNYKPLLHNDNLNVVLQEGSDVTNYPIIIRDGDDQYVAMDPDDRYEFTNVPQPIAPAGGVNFCRNQVNSYAESANPATCTPCNVLQAGIKYHESRICYLNYSPDSTDIAETFSLRIEVDDNGYNYPSGSTEAIFSMSISVLEDNEEPKLTDSDGNPLPGGETLSDPIVVSQPFIENIPGLFKVNASDGDKTLELKKVGFEIVEAYDVAQGNLPITVPERIEVTILEQEYDSSGVGSQTEAGIKWTPSDEDIKKYSGAGGVILKVKIFDNVLKPSESLFIYRYFKIELQNTNNIPSFLNLADTLEPQINTYFSKTITVVDEDEATPLLGSFQTQLNLCKDKFGAALAHDGRNELGVESSPALDDPLNTNPINCHAHSSLWGHKFTQFDPNYSDNADVSECRTISGGDNELNQDLAVPKLSRVAGPYFIDGKIAYDYLLEWCPQASQISEFGVDLVLTDNGDEDRQSNILGLKSGAVSLQVNVISPVFFESPKLSLQEVDGSSPLEYSLQPEHHMVQTTNRGGDDQFVYPLLINNSKNNPLSVTVLDGPRDCAEPNGLCVEPYAEGVENYKLTWHPKYPDDITTSDPNTWHRIELKVEDTVTGDEDIVHFFLQVNAAGTNLNRPSISSYLPASDNQVINELDLLNFSVVADDLDAFPQPELHYSWFVNDVLVFDRSSSYDFVPDKIQGGIDVDGTGPLEKGEHKIKVIVSDGSFTTSKEWSVKVNNTFLVPFSLFEMVSARAEIDGVIVTEPEWSLELPHEQTLYGAGGTEFFMNHLFISGSYKVGVVKKNFLWDLKIFEGQVSRDTTSSNPWNLYENLPWRDEEFSERLSYYYSGTTLNMLASAKSDRSGPYTTTQDAVKLTGNLSTISTPLAGGFKCVGACESQIYQGTDGYGHRLTETWGNYLFWVDDTGKELKFDFNGGNLLTVTDYFNYDADGSDDTVRGLEVNDALKRLYISTRDNITGTSYIHIYDLSPLGTQTSDSGSAVPSLIGSVPLNLPAPYSSESAGPTDIIVNPLTNDVYAFLASTGGVLYFNDSGSGVPTLSASNYLGLDKISASPTDLPSSGRKIVFNPTDNLLMGVSREGSQIFTVNPSFANAVSVHSYPSPMDALVNYLETGLSLVISRDLKSIFELK